MSGSRRLSQPTWTPVKRFPTIELQGKDLFHMAPAVCLKFRGFKRSARLLKKATDAALCSYVVSSERFPDVLSIPEIAFALCYLASHYGLDLMDQFEVDEVMCHVTDHREVIHEVILELTTKP